MLADTHLKLPLGRKLDWLARLLEDSYNECQTITLLYLIYS